MIRKYSDDDFPVLEQWVTDAVILFRFSGPDWQFPLTRMQLDAYMEKHHGKRQFYLGLHNDGEPYAFGEIIGQEANAPRLGRILVGDPSKRGKGLGQAFIGELIRETKLTYPDERFVYLFVFEDNAIGIACYKKLGFTFCEDTHFRLNYQGEEIKVLKMELSLMGN